MNQGICKLCQLLKELQESHFLPAGAYRLLVPENAGFQQPILMTRDTAILTSKQMQDYVFCSGCEKLFDQGGEDYAIRQMKSERGFRLLERLKVSPPIDFSVSEGVYAGDRIGIDAKKLGYFALSVAYKSAVHTWPSIRGHVPDSIDLGPWKEPIRKFLLGGPFPDNLTLLTTACTDQFSQNAMYAPTRLLGSPTPGVSFLACGIHFLMLLGIPNPPAVKDLCSYKTESIFSRDAGARTVHAYGQLHSTARMRGLLARHYAA